jgi:hypothetical protein
MDDKRIYREIWGEAIEFYHHQEEVRDNIVEPFLNVAEVFKTLHPSLHKYLLYARYCATREVHAPIIRGLMSDEYFTKCYGRMLRLMVYWNLDSERLREAYKEAMAKFDEQERLKKSKTQKFELYIKYYEDRVLAKEGLMDECLAEVDRRLYREVERYRALFTEEHEKSMLSHLQKIQSAKLTHEDRNTIKLHIKMNWTYEIVEKE